MGKKLTIEHLAPYLPYGLKVQYEGILNGSELKAHEKIEPRVSDYQNSEWEEWNNSSPEELKGIKVATIKEIRLFKKYVKLYAGTYHGFLKPLFPAQVKPILKPLSWFADINSQAMSDLNTDLGIQIELSNYAAGAISIQSVPWMVMAECFRHHIDVFKLIDAGLAIEEGGQG